MQAAFYQTQSQNALVLNVKNNLHTQESEMLTFNIISEDRYKHSKYRETSMYSLTVGEFIEIAKKVCKN